MCFGETSQIAEAVEEATPPQDLLPLPARALRSRLSSMTSQSKQPTWAAWLPPHFSAGVDCAAVVQPMNADDSAVLPQNMHVVMPVNDVYGSFDACSDYIPCMVFPCVTTMEAMIPDPATGTFFTYPQLQQCEYFDPAAPQEISVAGQLQGKVWDLARNSEGCWLVQTAFDNVTCDEEAMAIASGLEGHVWEACQCKHANYVIQKCIDKLRPPDLKFIIVELTERGPKSLTQVAKHRAGCRILQRLLEHCSAEQIEPIAEALLADAAEVSSHEFGHYVMKHICEHSSDDIVTRLAEILQDMIPTISADGYIYVGTVIGSALDRLDSINNKGRESLANALLEEPDKVVAMACSWKGHHAVKRALQLISAPERTKGCAELALSTSKLRANRYGRIVLQAM